MPCGSPLFSWRVIGIGNPLRGDDGLGCRVIDELQRLPLPEQVEAVDGGTGGMKLLSLFADAAGILLVDAVDMGLAPGTLVRCNGQELLEESRYCGAGDGHSGSLPQTLQLVALLQPLPEIVFIGLQVARVEYGRGLSAPLNSALPGLLTQIRQLLNTTPCAGRGEFFSGQSPSAQVNC